MMQFNQKIIIRQWKHIEQVDSSLFYDLPITIRRYGLKALKRSHDNDY